MCSCRMCSCRMCMQRDSETGAIRWRNSEEGLARCRGIMRQQSAWHAESVLRNSEMGQARLTRTRSWTVEHVLCVCIAIISEYTCMHRYNHVHAHTYTLMFTNARLSQTIGCQKHYGWQWLVLRCQAPSIQSHARTYTHTHIYTQTKCCKHNSKHNRVAGTCTAV